MAQIQWITDMQWSEFIEVATPVFESHQDLAFIETVALNLSDRVYNQYQVTLITSNVIRVIVYYYGA